MLALPTGLLDDPVVVKALRTRNFTVVFTALKAAGPSYHQIAEACAMKSERVSLVARGEATVTSFEAVERIADGLGIPGGFLGLAPRPWEKSTPTGSTEQPHEPSTGDLVKRRRALKVLIAGGLTTTALGQLAGERHTLDAALAGHPTPTDLDYWEQVADTYALGYGGQPPAARLAEIAADVVELRTLLGRPQTAADRGRLCRTVGQLSGMAAIVLHDLGEAQEARGWFHSARLAANESGDRQVLAWICAREAMTPLTYGVPREAVRLADRPWTQRAPPRRPQALWPRRCPPGPTRSAATPKPPAKPWPGHRRSPSTSTRKAPPTHGSDCRNKNSSSTCRTPSPG
ncbi:hypothetical protein GCM10018781_60930 [Kitasatospora indigofera]|uniref:XRE family transcriptional regulator n=1 Tax=Kitasatospora indigofera TaxID=67307 RepID=A0A919L209_9ACTN|nr:hypothetical protein [Kitasatospora indigofera]GHH80469.1 hypothetical protein GCM10018781_60930 [Kitasatospora indigofera]